MDDLDDENQNDGVYDPSIEEIVEDQINTDIGDYSIEELFNLIGANNDTDEKDIINITNGYADKFKNSNRSLFVFFKKVQNLLLNYLSQVNLSSISPILDEEDDDPNEGKNLDMMKLQLIKNLDLDKKINKIENENIDENDEKSLEDLDKKILTPLINVQDNIYYNKSNNNNNENDANQQSRTIIQDFVQSSSDPWLNRQVLEDNSIGTAIAGEKGVQTQSTDAINPSVKSFSVSQKQGIINPNIKNTITQMVTIDSSYRSSISEGNTNSDNFTFILEEPLNNTLSMFLYTIEIPYSWYTFTEDKGTNSFAIRVMIKGRLYPPDDFLEITISEGNYGLLTLYEKINEALNSALNKIITENEWNYDTDNNLKIIQDHLLNSETTTDTRWITFNQQPINGRTQISYEKNYINNSIGSITLPMGIEFIWFDITFSIPSMVNSKLNNNLGWLLGFRTLRVTLPTCIIDDGDLFDICNIDDTSTDIVRYTSESIPQIEGTKYILLKLNDFQSNRPNKGIIGINSTGATFSDIEISKGGWGRKIGNRGPNILDPTITAPRTVTGKKIKSAAQLAINRFEETSRLRGNSPDSNDIFARIPLKSRAEWNTYSTNTTNGDKVVGFTSIPGNLITIDSGFIQKNSREYFGPVNIKQMSVTLFDDKGNLLGLNGVDWSFSIIVESLYEY